MNIYGVYRKTLYRNRESGLTTFIVDVSNPDNNGIKNHFCTGSIPFIPQGAPVCIEGETSVKKDKLVFNVNKCDINVSERGLLQKFIYANLPTGLGFKASERVLELLNSLDCSIETFIEDEDSIEKLSKLKGFSKNQSISFLNKIKKTLFEKDLFYSLSKYGITYNQTVELSKKYGNDIYDVLKKDPYESLSYIGVDLSVMDIYAKENGIDYLSKSRIKVFSDKMSDFMSEYGHSYLTIEEYIRLFRVKENIISAFEERIPKSMIRFGAFSSNSFIKEQKGSTTIVINKKAFNTEKEIATELKRLKETSQPFIEQKYIDIYKNNCTVLDDTQKTMLDTLNNTDTCFLIGGPGTGKTTTIKAMVDLIKHYSPDKHIVLCAPSGRAAQNISESTNERASTIHLSLEYHFEGLEAVPGKDKNNPIDADVIIVDEFSMVGIYLFNNLLKALRNGTKLILIGDWNQLQPSEPGNLLHDLVNSGKFRYVSLTNVHRQAKDSHIITNALKLLSGKTDFAQGDDYKVIRCANNEEGKIRVKEEFLKRYDQNDLKKILIISPSASGPDGCEILNSYIQGCLHSTSEPYITYKDSLLFEGDKVMTIHNRYGNDPYFNGDIWKLDSVIDEDTVHLKNEENRILTINGEKFDDVSLAYSMTVHKCQGSEADTCIIYLPNNIPKMLFTRSLIYTASTRAKKECIIITVNDTLEKYAASPVHEIRRSMIGTLIANNF